MSEPPPTTLDIVGRLTRSWHSKMGTLFAHLALKFGSHPENLATEALCFMLAKSSTADAAFRGILERVGIRIPESLRWVTQVSGDDGARPDLVGVDASGAQPVIIEAKFWAGFTEKQPVTYLKRLPAGGVLCVVGPAKRHALLVSELKRRILEHEESQVYSETRTFAETTVATVNQNHLVVLSWRAVLAAIIASAEQEGECALAEDARQLDGLCEKEDAKSFLPVSSEELTAHGQCHRIVQFCDLVDDLTERLEQRGLTDRKGLRPVAGKGFYGRYLRLRRVGVLLLCDLRKWTTYASTPFWLSIQGPTFREPHQAKEALAPLEHENPRRMFIAHDGYPTVPLFVPTGVEKDAVLKMLVEQVVGVGELIAPLGADASAGGTNIDPAPGLADVVEDAENGG